MEHDFSSSSKEETLNFIYYIFHLIYIVENDKIRVIFDEKNQNIHQYKIMIIHNINMNKSLIKFENCINIIKDIKVDILFNGIKSTIIYTDNYIYVEDVKNDESSFKLYVENIISQKNINSQFLIKIDYYIKTKAIFEFFNQQDYTIWVSFFNFIIKRKKI